jgi:glycosyltransferase involved in cell wall biosynthesis
MIRVLNIISDTNIGGAGRVILNYLYDSDRSRFETLVAIPRGSLLKQPLEQAGAQVLEVDGMADRSYDSQDVKTLQALIRQVKPDLVHTHGALSGRIAAKRCHVPVVYSRHSAFPVPAKLKYPPGRWINKLFNQHYADHIIAVSPATRDNLTQAGISPKKITVVMNGVTPLAATSPQEQAALRQTLGLAEDTFLFGILARIEPYKGHLCLVEAAKRLKEQGHSKFCILIAGTGTFQEEVAKAIVQQDVGDVVHMLGFRSDVGALLNLLDVQLNASYGTEATSMALLEGMSLGLPSIVSDYGGNPFVITNGDNGLIFPAQNSQALADCMAQLMDHRDILQAMGQRAKAVFAARFTSQVFARNTEQVYLDILKGAT